VNRGNKSTQLVLRGVGWRLFAGGVVEETRDCQAVDVAIVDGALFAYWMCLATSDCCIFCIDCSLDIWRSVQ
jgi:hypothetical protein